MLLSAAAAGLLASIATLLDWRLNPGGLFHGADGTAWNIVLQTWLSWFLPTGLVCLSLSLAILVWQLRRKK